MVLIGRVGLMPHRPFSRKTQTWQPPFWPDSTQKRRAVRSCKPVCRKVGCSGRGVTNMGRCCRRCASIEVGSSTSPTQSRRCSTPRQFGHLWRQTNERALTLSQSGPLAGVPFHCFPTSYATRMDSEIFRTLLLRRLRLPLPLNARVCRCGRLPNCLGHHRSACAQVLWSGEVSRWRLLWHASVERAEQGSRPT